MRIIDGVIRHGAGLTAGPGFSLAIRPQISGCFMKKQTSKHFYTPEEIRQVLRGALRKSGNESPPEKLKNVYDKAYAHVCETWNDYDDILPKPPKHSDDCLTGAKSLLVWCSQADEAIYSIPLRIDPNILDEIIANLKKLGEIPNTARSFINENLWRKAWKPQHKQESEPTLNSQQRAIQTYLALDDNFMDRLSGLKKDIIQATDSLNSLLASATPTGRLIHAYCKLTSRPLLLSEYYLMLYQHFRKDSFGLNSSLMQSVFFAEVGGLSLVAPFMTVLTEIKQMQKGQEAESEKEDEQEEYPPIGFASEIEHDCVFKNIGDTWRIVYEGQETTVKDAKGVQYIHYLLKSPKEPEECLDIEKACSNAPDRDIKSISESEALEADLHTDQINLERLDDFQPEDIRKAKHKLEADMENTDDPSKKMELKEQIQAFEKYLSHDLNIHGERRPEGKLETARKRVSMAINTAKRNITSNNQQIGEHFQSAIKAEGTKFVYKPGRDITWMLE